MTLINWHNGAANPLLRQGLLNFERVAPRVVIPRGEGPVRPLRGMTTPVASHPGPWALTDVVFNDSDGHSTTLGQWLAASDTNGYLLLRQGRVLLGHYAHGLQPGQHHAVMSISKSLLGTLAMGLLQQGRLSAALPVVAAVPELANSAYRDVPVAALLAMTSGVAFNADTSDPASDVIRLSAAIGWRPPAANAPRTLRCFLASLERRFAPPGVAFAYNDADTEVLAWVLERVCGQPLVTLLSRELWARSGAADHAWISVDPAGVAVTSAGLQLTLADLGRFALWCLAAGDKALVPLTAADQGVFGQPLPALEGVLRAYAGQWWLLDDGYALLGNNGQSVVILPGAELIAVKLSAMVNDRPGVIAREHATACRAAWALAHALS